MGLVFGGVDFSFRQGHEACPKRPDQFWGQSRLLFHGIRRTVSLGLKCLGHQSYISPPSAAQVSETWNCT